MAMLGGNFVHLAVAHRRKADGLKGSIERKTRDRFFEMCQLLILPDRERLRYVRAFETQFGFSVLEKPQAKKKPALKPVT
jgi:hypothetical protein